ncbi:glucosidase II beta subunit-like-domain-containing protein [Mycena pura]|uniref:Glucosidase 2 subunit beta n=1 Tax=Mycena pura TaxID=153505 RepID=A0AAD6YU73_9AGAR|nr:glucosidase II beta subunit-like-domain-containing protein [Mycena pura]
MVWLWLLALPLPALASIDKTLGVPPTLLSRYSPPKSGSWKCLDSSKEIPWDFVNDDSCDCPDGSDEPGTSACPNSTFYCQNVGHIGATIPSSRVNDGLCEPQCCDGSDERPGVCPNSCTEIGEQYRKQRDAERKIQKTGAKIRSSYIVFAHKEKKRLEGLLESLTQEIVVREKEVTRLRDIADRTESLSAAALEHKKQSPLYTTLVSQAAALRTLQREHKKHLERERELGDILDALRKGYNPNYQDMAVLEAVRGWEYLAGLPHIGVEEDAQTAAAEEDISDEEAGIEESDEKKEEDTVVNEEEEEWTVEDLETGLDDLLNTDYVSLLMAHDEHAKIPPSNPVFHLRSYLPESFIPQYEEMRETIISWLETIGITGSDNESGAARDTSKAREALNNAESALNRAKKDKKEAEEDLSEIFDVEGFGAEGEWKKLDNTCLELDTGEYTYEVCMFNEARQKPNKGGTTHSLGKFASWNPSPDVKPGEPAYYEKQVYNKGTRCWNGPERNVVLVMTCGTDNAIHTVVELEKCEYQFTGTSPALCLPLDANGNGNREEL